MPPTAVQHYSAMS